MISLSAIRTYFTNRRTERLDGVPQSVAGQNSLWIPCLAAACLGGVLFIIAAVVVLALIPLYLPTKGTSVNVSTNNKVRLLTASFASNIDNDASSLQLTNYDSLTQQFNDHLGYKNKEVTVTSANIMSTTAKNLKKKKRKRQTSELSCDNTVRGIRATSKGKARLFVTFYLNSCPGSQCKTDKCIEKCSGSIQATIQSVFSSGSISLKIQLANGTTITTSLRICSFNQPVPGTENNA
ncbi:unnamed protein product [Adineta ricciae]|uniref:Uncharacterized protein n=1 Tax=Adineta ricciae TaxID=249248 RepID=A0A815UNN9_ADIRI|nr:unnamed protein product [Adineta ricciae]